MDPNVKSILKSIKNDNVYNLYDERIVVQTGTGVKEIPMPSGEKFICFYDIYYIQNKLFAILVTTDAYDMRIEIDEDNIAFIGSPIPTY